MRVNPGFFVAKFLKLINRAALRNCNIDKKADIGSGSNCIGTTVEKYTYMGKNCVAVNAHIGPFCSIAGYCCIGGGAHPTNLISTSPVFYEGRNAFGKNFSRIKFDEAKPVSIGADVWIGEKAFIKDGITIGTGAIIGAQSIVTHDVPPYAIVGGVPARIIRFRFDQDTIQTLLETEWWTLDEDKLETVAKYLQNKEITKYNIINACKQI